VSNVQYERKYIDKALIKLKLQGKVELKTTKTGIAKSLDVELVSIDGIKYGFLKYYRS
jgi:hypothetical protein